MLCNGPFRRRWSFLFLAVCLVALPAFPATGSTPQNPRHFDATSFGRSVHLGPDWLFHPGDNPAWAAPSFDDSHWTVVSTRRLLPAYGYHDLRHGWYRMHIHLRPGTSDLSIGLQTIAGAYQIYANGTLIGSSGDVSRQHVFYQPSLSSFPIPHKLLDSDGNLVLAIRVAMAPAGRRGPGTSTPIQAGSSIQLLPTNSAAQQINESMLHSTLQYWIVACFSLLIAIVAAALYGTLRNRPEYLACTVLLLAISGIYFVNLWMFNSTGGLLPVTTRAFMIGTLYSALIEFVRLVLRIPRRRWLVACQLTCFLAPFAQPIAQSVGNFFYYPGFVLYFLPLLITFAVLPALLARSSWRGNREAWVLLPTIVILGLTFYWGAAALILFYTHITSALHLPSPVRLGSIHLSAGVLEMLLFLISILLFLVIRTVGIARRNAQVNAELQAARSTQELLLARSAEHTPGFSVETAYSPAGELGGDFFLVSPQNDGSLAVIVGDVSGKGLNAALRVSMILGVLRREKAFDPATVLAHLNDVLAADHDSGFTTACCLRITPDGNFTVANAGHISPYLDGKELPTAPGLPLGLVPGQQYETTSGRIHNGQHLVLISDGVVEARNPKGHLLGFDRVPDLTRQPANHILDTARDFGQEDDITVLRITLDAEPTTVAAPAGPQLSPA